MSIAERVVAEILKQQMLQVYSTHPDAQFTIEFKANAIEQLEAVISEQLVINGAEYLKREREGGQ